MLRYVAAEDPYVLVVTPARTAPTHTADDRETPDRGPNE